MPRRMLAELGYHGDAASIGGLSRGNGWPRIVSRVRHCRQLMSLEHNRRAWDAMVARGQRFTRPARDEDFADPLRKVDPIGWLGTSIRGRTLLCLAAGGGKHGPLYAAAGAVVTVVDLSPAMLELDRQVAVERRLDLRTIEASMDDLSMLGAAEFDLVIHPVSTCYLPEIGPVYREIARVTRPGGLYISQHKSPTSLQADVVPGSRGYELAEPYYRSGPLPPCWVVPTARKARSSTCTAGRSSSASCVGRDLSSKTWSNPCMPGLMRSPAVSNTGASSWRRTYASRRGGRERRRSLAATPFGRPPEALPPNPARLLWAAILCGYSLPASALSTTCFIASPMSTV
jgi:SAM-dependent methyltransferase